jgi:hypothetical protein
MRETSPRGWHRRRIATRNAILFDRMTRVAETPPAAVRNSSEVKGPDGIRHELVARIRQQIADGTYDTEEKWLLAEEALLRRIEGLA